MLGERGYISIYETETYNKQVYSGNEFESSRDRQSFSLFSYVIFTFQWTISHTRNPTG
jgi:hypothetical protein